jgi:hypothetical protein
VGIFLFTTVSRPALEPTQLASKGARGLYLVVRPPMSEADHSPPSSVEIKNAWSYTSTPQYLFVACCLVNVFMAWYLVKHKKT